MEIEDKVFQRKRTNFLKVREYGFLEEGEGYHLEKDFMDGEFRAVIEIDGEGHISGQVIDQMNSEVYVPLRILSRSGTYVSAVRSAYEGILTDIAEKCCEDVLFASDQANRIAERIYRKYGDRPDFPWDEKPYQTSGTFRHKDTSKWYALIMNVKRSVLERSAGDEKTDIVNLKINEKDGEALRKEAGIYPAYHMNHKHWISVVLDGTLEDGRIMELIDVSYYLTDQRKNDCFSSKTPI